MGKQVGVRAAGAALVWGLLTAVTGCGDDTSAPGSLPDGGRMLGVIMAAPPVGDFDASMMQTPDAGEPLVDAGGDEPDATMPEPDAAAPLDESVAIVGQVLTNAPHLGFIDEGTQGLRIVSAGFHVLPFASGLAGVLMYGDLENQGTERQCIVRSDRFRFDGGLDELVVTAGHPHISPTLDLVTECVEPGERIVWQGIMNDVSPTFIEDAADVRYAFTGGSSFSGDYMRDPLEPDVLYADPVMGDVGYAIVGLFRTPEMALYNMSIDFFARSRDGIIFDDTAAYPNDLDTLLPNQTLSYESFAFGFSDEEPDSVTYFVGYIHGTNPEPNTQTVFDAAEGPDAQQVLEQHHAQRAYREARARLASHR